MTQSTLLKRLAALERENKMLRTTLEEAGWIEGRAVIWAAMRWYRFTMRLSEIHPVVITNELGPLDCACARLAAKRRARKAK